MAQHDPEPTAVALQGLALLPLAHRERPDDAEPWHAGEDLRGAQRRVEPVFHPGIRRRNAAGRSLYPGIASIPAAIGLGTMAVHPEEAAGHQRSYSGISDQSSPYRKSGAAAAAHAGEWHCQRTHRHRPSEWA